MPDDAPPPREPAIVTGGRPVFAEAESPSGAGGGEPDSPPGSPARVAGGLAALCVIAALLFLVCYSLESLRRGLPGQAADGGGSVSAEEASAPAP